MPRRRKGQSKSSYIKECIHYVVHKEGRSPQQAVGKCLGMANQPRKKKKSKK